MAKPVPVLGSLPVTLAVSVRLFLQQSDSYDSHFSQAFDVPKCSGQTQARSLLAVKARVGIRPISSVTCHNRQILKMVQKKQFEGEISS